MKTCKKCKEEKELSEFYKDKRAKDDLFLYCKSCQKEYRKEYRKNNKEKIKEKKKEYYENNKEYFKELYKNNIEYFKEKHKEYKEKNKEKIKEKRKEYFKEYRKNNKEKIKEKNKKYYENNKEYHNEYNKEYQKNKKQTNPLFKLRGNIRGLIRQSIKRKGYTKRSQTYNILGCTYEEFKKHLENQFTKGMSWENQGEWHLDHIYPVSLAKDEEELYKLNHYTNFQPLWAEDNFKKGNKIIEQQLKLL
jgi:hypothetical protein